MRAAKLQQSEGDLKTIFQLILWLGSAAFLAGLIVLGVSGWFARYLQDDYCFDFMLKRNGFFNAQVFTFFHELNFNGNRFSANLVMGLLAHLGPLSARFLPALLLTTWLAGSYWLLRGLDGLFQWRRPPAFLFFTALSIVFLSLVQAPNLYQVLFWRPAAVTYLMPLVLMTLLFAFIVHLIQNENKSPFSSLLCCLAAFWVGGHSETAAVFLSASLSIILFWLKVRRPLQGGNLGRIANRLVIAAWIGALLSILLLLLSPSDRLRQAALFPLPPNLLDMLRISLDGVRQFILFALYRQTLPSLLLCLVYFFAGFFLSHFSPRTMGLRKSPLLFHLFLTLLTAFLLLFCIALPGVYASPSFPDGRVLLWARFTFVMAAMALSMLSGDWLGRYVFNPVRRRLLVAMGFSIACITLVMMIFTPAQAQFQPAFPEMRAWLGQRPIHLAGLAVVFFWIFWVVSRIRLEKRFIEEWIPFLLLILFFSFCLTSLPQLFASLPAYQLRAKLWDWRDAQVLASIRRGTYEMELPALDSIAGLTELQSDPDHWVNNCAELYYGMKSIRAVPPLLTAIPGDKAAGEKP